MKRPFRNSMILILLTFFCLTAAGGAYAQATTWVGGGTTDFWSDGGNWSAGPPGAGSIVYFASVGGISRMDINGLTLNSLLMNTASWSGTLVFEGNLTVNNTSVLTSQVQLQNRQIDANYSLEIAPGCTLDTGNGSINAAGNLIINGTVTGSGAIAPQSQILGSASGSINGAITIVSMAAPTDLSALSSVNMTGGGFSTSMGGSLALPPGAILGTYGYSGAGGSLACTGGTAQILGTFGVGGDLSIGSASLEIFGPVSIGGTVYNNSGAGQTYTFHDDITISSGALQFSAGGITLNFGAGKTIDVAAGAGFTVSAWEANRITMQQDGTSGGSQWTLDHDPAATVSITAAEIQDGHATPPLTVSLCLDNGNNTGFIFPSDIAVVPDTLDFGPVEPNTTEAGTLMVYNTAAAGTLHVTGVTAGTPYFVPAVTAFDVAAGDSQLVSVEFTPPNVGVYTDTLSIFSDDPVDSIFTVPVQGLGAGADLYVSGVDIYGVTHGYELLQGGVQVTNSGDSGSGSFRVTFRVSEDAVITTADVILDSARVTNVDPGGDASVSFAAPPPKTMPRGQVYLGYFVDDLEEVSEYDEDNNTYYNPITFYAPVVYSVRDIPGDQGGYVYLSWYSSALDLPSGGGTITQYSIWRAMSAVAAMSKIESGSAKVLGPGEPVLAGGPDVIRIERIAGQTFFWHPIDTTGAYHLDSYGYPEPTMFDSTAVAWEYNYYQVIAHTSDELVFYISAPDSGYSVDDLAPAMPENLAGEQSQAEGLQLTWDPNTEPDLAHYAVYRGTAAGFTPDAGNLVDLPAAPGLFDGDWRWDGGYHYKVAAVDIHGNFSVFAALGPDLVTAAGETGPPPVNYLAQNRPNPFGGGTRIGFGLAEGALVSVRVYDVKGRLVRELINESLGPEHHSVVWDGRDDRGEVVAGGVYFYRLTAGPYVQTRKLTLVR